MKIHYPFDLCIHDVKIKVGSTAFEWLLSGGGNSATRNFMPMVHSPTLRTVHDETVLGGFQTTTVSNLDKYIFHLDVKM